MTIETAYADGQLAALDRLKLGWPAPTHPVVQDSALLRARETPTTPPAAQEALAPPTTPPDVSQIFSVHEQGKTRAEPRRKLSGIARWVIAAEMCTTCRREKHYGPCSAPRRIPTKAADFNLGMTGDDPSTGDNPSTSPHYHAATTADSSLARARDGRPSDEQAATGFADLFRHLGISNAADEPGRMYGGLNKVAYTLAELGLATSTGVPALAAGVHDRSIGSAVGAGLGGAVGGALGGIGGLALADVLGGGPVGGLAGLTSYLGGTALGGLAGRHVAKKLADFMLPGSETHSLHEQRGPSTNPYEERLTIKSPPVGWGDEGPQRVRRAFDQIDGAVDTTNIGGGFGDPQPGPAALG